MTKSLHSQFKDLKQTGKKYFSVLLDPDHLDQQTLLDSMALAEDVGVDLFFIGGSLVSNNEIDFWCKFIKSHSKIPVIIFPGSPQQISDSADAILLLSLISGRNPELLIGQHVLAAPILHQMDLEILSTGYMLVDGGSPTTVSYISHSHPIPHDKPSIAVCTALAGQMLGMSQIYLDSGSGAKRPVSEKMITKVSKTIEIPLIVGGGIRSAETAFRTSQAGADIIVVGNALEENPSLMQELAQAVHAPINAL